jgi:hypothetical protein
MIISIDKFADFEVCDSMVHCYDRQIRAVVIIAILLLI